MYIEGVICGVGVFFSLFFFFQATINTTTNNNKYGAVH